MTTPAKTAKPIYYRCGICECFHPINWNGDCRDNANRFAMDDRKRGVRQLQTIKTGTRIEFFVSHPDGHNEMATIARWTAVNGAVENHVHDNAGWHIVKFNDGGKLCVHETSFRVIDNRAGI